MRMNCSGKETDLCRGRGNFLTNEVNKRFIVLMPHSRMIIRSELQTKVECNWKDTMRYQKIRQNVGRYQIYTVLVLEVCWQLSQQIKG